MEKIIARDLQTQKRRLGPGPGFALLLFFFFPPQCGVSQTANLSGHPLPSFCHEKTELGQHSPKYVLRVLFPSRCFGWKWSPGLHLLQERQCTGPTVVDAPDRLIQCLFPHLPSLNLSLSAVFPKRLGARTSAIIRTLVEIHRYRTWFWNQCGEEGDFHETDMVRCLSSRIVAEVP